MSAQRQPTPAADRTTGIPRARLPAVAAPLFAELALGIGVGMAGTALAARLGDAQAATFALAQHVVGTLFILMRIVGAGVSVVVAQALGRGERGAADAVARAAMGASSWLGLTIALASVALAEPMLRALNTPASLVPGAALLLQWLAPALLLDAWNATQSSVMRAHLRGRDVLRVIVAMQVLQLALAAGLMPRMGLAGYAVALLASRALGLGLHLWLWRERLAIEPGGAYWWRLRWPELRAVTAIGAPGAAENILYRVCFTATIAVAAALGAPALAAHAYTSQVNHLVLLAGLATGLAVEIVLGHHVGAGRLRVADRLVRRALAIGLAVSLLAALAAALAGPALLGLFTRDPAIVAAAAGLLWWSVVLEPGRTFNLVLVNALRAAGDARFPAAAGALSMTLVLAGGGWWLGHHLGLGLAGLWVAYAADEWLRGLAMWWRWRSLGWVPHARAAHRRLRTLAT